MNGRFIGRGRLARPSEIVIVLSASGFDSLVEAHVSPPAWGKAHCHGWIVTVPPVPAGRRRPRMDAAVG
jgi:hypothetical protein